MPKFEALWVFCSDKERDEDDDMFLFCLNLYIYEVKGQKKTKKTRQYQMGLVEKCKGKMGNWVLLRFENYIQIINIHLYVYIYRCGVCRESWNVEAMKKLTSPQLLSLSLSIYIYIYLYYSIL